ncbi:MAG: two-component regulator propeller domain-containing protein, partial [Rikenellaceae bacterium]
MNKTFFISIILALLGVNAFAEDISSEYVKTTITSFNGLPQNDVHDIILDSYGLMWMATNDGLCCTDGVDFRTFSVGKAGLGSSLILSIAEDSRGNIWIGTADKGLYYYMRDRNRFYHYTELFDKTIELNTIVSSIKSIKIDPSGVIWAHNRPNTTILRIEFDMTQMNIRSIKTLPIAGSGRLTELSIALVKDQVYMSGANTLYLYNNELEQFVKVEQAKLRSNSMAICSNDNWIFLSQSNGLYCYNVETAEGFYTSLELMPTKIKWINNALWITSKSGLYRCTFDFANNRLERIDRIDEYENLFPVAITADNCGGVWIGFTKVGIKRYEEDLTPFMLRDGFGNDIILSISAMSNGDIFVGTEGSGAYIIDNKSGVEGDIKRNLRKGSTAFSMDYSAHNGMIYLSTRSALYQIDPSRDYTQQKILENTSIRKLLSHDKYIWMATYDFGLLRLNIDSGECISVEGLPSPIVRNLMVDKGQNLWVCTSKGVVRVDNEQLDRAMPKVNNTLFESSESHYSIPIIEDQKGEIWYGTLGSGLLRLTPIDGDKRYKLKRYSIEDGLPSNTIKSIIEDNHGTIWISTNRGLSHLTKSDDKGLEIKNYNISSSLNNYEFCENSSLKLPSGEILFGGVRGITHFNPSNFKIDD